MARRCRLIANLSPQEIAHGSPRAAGTPIWGGEPGDGRAALVGVLAHRRLAMPPAIPIATYRLQLTAGLRFRRRPRQSCPT